MRGAAELFAALYFNFKEEQNAYIFQQLCLLLFLWLLKLVDGLMEIFSAISGITDVTYKGEKVNIIEFLAGDSTVNTIFWCIFILAIGLTCIFTIAALIKI